MPWNFVSLLPRLRRQSASRGAGSDLLGEIAIAIVRYTLGGVMFVHAAQKVFGWFGGAGLAATVESFTQGLGLPKPIAILAIVTELLSATGLFVGFLGRLAALGILAIMIGAIALVHAPNGFFMNWMGNKTGEGFEYHLLALAMAVAVLVKGSGAASIDQLIALARRRKDACQGAERHGEGAAGPPVP